MKQWRWGQCPSTSLPSVSLGTGGTSGQRIPQRGAAHVCRPPVPVARFFRLTDSRQIDASRRRYLAEAYRVGRREHLR